MAKSKYYDYVEPKLDEIRQMAADGATYLEMAESLGISESAFYKYLRLHTDLKIAIIEGRQSVVVEIKRTLLKKALGFNYTERKIVTKEVDGEVMTTEEEHEKYCLPSEQAANMLLRNMDDTFVDRDKTSVNLRKEELELKKKIAESNSFDFFGSEGADMTQEEE